MSTREVHKIIDNVTFISYSNRRQSWQGDAMANLATFWKGKRQEELLRLVGVYRLRIIDHAYLKARIANGTPLQTPPESIRVFLDQLVIDVQTYFQNDCTDGRSERAFENVLADETRNIELGVLWEEVYEKEIATRGITFAHVPMMREEPEEFVS